MLVGALLFMMLVAGLAQIATRRSSRTLRTGSAALDAQPSMRVVVGVGLMLAVLFTLDPQLRALLLFVDAVGIEWYATILAIFLRYHVAIVASMVLLPALRMIYRLGPVPGFWPHAEILRTNFALALYAIVLPVGVVSLAAATAYCTIARLLV